jgi:hypothetical protein
MPQRDVPMYGATMRSFVRVALSLSLSISPFVACSSSDSAPATAPPSSSGVYRGLLTGPNETGVLDVTLAGDAKTLSTVGIRANGSPAGVSGTIAIAGGTVTLTGSYDSATGQLTLTGTNANGTYALAGTTSSSGFTGTYNGPNGSMGVWSLTSAANGSAELYCGTYSTAAGQVAGVWNLVIGSGVGTGAHCDAKSCGALTATVSGTTITITDPSKPGDPPSTGTISGGMASGTIPGKNGGGTFTGSTSACSAAPPVPPPPPPPVDSGTDATMMDAGNDAAPAVIETFAASVNDPVALSLDATHVYWLSGGDAAIRRCPLAGCAAGPETVASSLSVSSSVAAANGTIYFTSGFRYLMSCAVGAGGTCTPAQFTDLGAAVNAYPAHLWVTGTRLYWVAENAQTRLIQTCPLAGCTAGYPKTVYTSAVGSVIHNAPLAGLVVNATDAYLTSYTGGVFRFPLTDPETATAGNGTQVQPSAFATSGLDLDGTTMRWGLLGDGKIVECTTPTCATVTDFVTSQAAPGETRSNAAYVYGFNRGTAKVGGGYNASTGSVWRVKKP